MIISSDRLLPKQRWWAIIFMPLLLLAFPAHAAGHFSVLATPPEIDYHGHAPCDSFPRDSMLIDTRPVAIEVRWEGFFGWGQWGHDSVVRLGCARGQPQRFDCETWAPGFFRVWVRLQHEGGTTCWSEPLGLVARGNR